MKGEIICDLDGTLCNHSHRQAWVQGPKKSYEMYNSLCHLDTPNQAVLNTIRLFAEDGHRIRLFSGRVESWRITTAKWLAYYEVPYSSLHMRAVDDYRSDDVIKEEMYRRNINNPVLFVLDDRQKVVDMWRRIGLTCFQVAPGDF